MVPVTDVILGADGLPVARRGCIKRNLKLDFLMEAIQFKRSEKKGAAGSTTLFEQGRNILTMKTKGRDDAAANDGSKETNIHSRARGDEQRAKQTKEKKVVTNICYMEPFDDFNAFRLQSSTTTKEQDKMTTNNIRFHQNDDDDTTSLNSSLVSSSNTHNTKFSMSTVDLNDCAPPNSTTKETVTYDPWDIHFNGKEEAAFDNANVPPCDELLSFVEEIYVPSSSPTRNNGDDASKTNDSAISELSFLSITKDVKVNKEEETKKKHQGNAKADASKNKKKRSASSLTFMSSGQTSLCSSYDSFTNASTASAALASEALASASSSESSSFHFDSGDEDDLQRMIRELDYEQAALSPLVLEGGVVEQGPANKKRRGAVVEDMLGRRSLYRLRKASNTEDHYLFPIPTPIRAVRLNFGVVDYHVEYKTACQETEATTTV